MSTVPHLSTKAFKVWLAGPPVYRAQAKSLFEQLAEGIANRTGNSESWRNLRDIVSRNVR